MGQILINALVTIVCAFFVALPAILYARKGLLQGQANGAGLLETKVTAANAATLAEAASAKTDLLLAGNDRIHELVNSGSDVLKEEIRGLKEQLAKAHQQTTQLTETINGLLVRLLRPPRPIRVALAPKPTPRTRKTR